MTTAAAVDLSVQVGAVRLRNPILAASGTFGYGIEFAHLVDLNRLGGIVVKGLSREPIEGAPAPRLVRDPFRHAERRWTPKRRCPGLRGGKTSGTEKIRGTGISPTSSATTVEDYVEVIRILEDAEGLAGYELNISCPNVKKGGMQFGGDPGLVAEVVGAARKAAVRRPFGSSSRHWLQTLDLLPWRQPKLGPTP